MQTLAPITGMIVAGSHATLFARILGALGVPITPGSLTSIAYTVTDLTDGTQLVASTAIPLTAVTTYLVQTDPRWTQDSMTAPGPDGLWGYNFSALIPNTSLPPITSPQPAADNWFQPTPLGPGIQIDVRFTATSGETFVVPWRAQTWPVYG